MVIEEIKVNPKWIVHTTDIGNKLRELCVGVKTPLDDKTYQVAQKLVSYIEAGKYDDAIEKGIKPGVGLAAPQIGENINLTYISCPVLKRGSYEYRNYLLANPVIIEKSSKIIALDGGEGCLSIKEKVDGLVPRSKQITIKAYDVFDDREKIIQVSGYLSIVFQHEIDHLNGVLYPDHIDNENPWKLKKGWKLV